MKFVKILFASSLLIAGFAAAAHAMDDGRETIVQAVSTHPEVQAKWHSFRATQHEREAARGGYRPKIDVSAGIGRDALSGTGYAGTDLRDYTRNGVALFITQMIYDGNLTNSSVKRFSHAVKMRYFDMLATIEQTALAAFHVHADMVRYKNLVILSEKNLERHAELMLKVEERTLAGVDSSVNLETARGRLALARSNLITAQSNMHDTVTQYIRIVGNPPPPDIGDIDLAVQLPGTPETGVYNAMRRNSVLFSYAENSRTAYYIIEENKAKMRPTLELRFGVTDDLNVSGTEGWKRRFYAELAFKFNLYNGGIDRANIRRSQEQHLESIEIFKKLERDITQSVLVSHNDVLAYEKQLP